MKAENTTRIQFDSLSVNEAYARGAVAAFWPAMTLPFPSWPTSRRLYRKR